VLVAESTKPHHYSTDFRDLPVFWQFEGLYGCDGILPVRQQLEMARRLHWTLYPTLVRFHSTLDLDVYWVCNFLSVVGLVLSGGNVYIYVRMYVLGMYVYMYTCMCWVCIYTRIHVCIGYVYYGYVYYMHTRMYWVCMYTCLHVYIEYVYIHVYMYVLGL